MELKGQKRLYIIGSLCLFLGLLTLVFSVFHLKEKERGVTLRRLSLSEIPCPCCQRPENIREGIRTSISILSSSDQRYFPLFGKKIDKNKLINALKLLERRLEKGCDLRSALFGIFAPFELVEGGKEGRGLVTGYFQPRLKGSLLRTANFSVPVLGWPRDLIQVRLWDFDNSLPRRSLWGRLENKRLVPYYSRLEIDKRLKERRESMPVICWLKSPVDLLELQIQGSGIIEAGNETRFIHYAASNGRPYVSLGRLLIKEGIFSKKGLDWPSIRKWAEENPGLFNRFLSKNERYVFFKWEKEGPVGCYGRLLVPGVSSALDRRVFPPAVPLLVRLELPETRKSPKWLKGGVAEEKTLFVLNHDTGSAIKGPLRMDLYAGTGEAAGELAGHLKSRARMIVLLPASSLK